jgi:hydrogenase maturation protease
MIDATMDGKPPGTISVIKPRFASDFPKSLSAHDIGLKDMIESITLLDKLPDIILITVSIKQIEGLSLELSPVIKNTIPAIISEVEKLVADINDIKIAD